MIGDDLREAYETPTSPMVVSGCIGPRGDSYVPGEIMSEGEAEAYHAFQVDASDRIELGGRYRDLVQAHPQINVLGGCCGTDHRNVECIALACRRCAW